MGRACYASEFFSLRLANTYSGIELAMQTKGEVHTGNMSNITAFFLKNFPSVLKTRCFNEQKLPFAIEVRQTELGHLFEHILLSQLCLSKIAFGSKAAVFNGRTFWNWKKEPYGFFRIRIEISQNDMILLDKALINTILLTEKLLKTHTYTAKLRTTRKGVARNKN